MGYFKSVLIDISEAIEQEIKIGFESFDELSEVIEDIAYEYSLPKDVVWKLYLEGIDRC